MAFDDALAARVRRLLEGRSDVVEKAMFGGVAFMVRGHMTVGLVNDDLVVRVDTADGERLLAEPHARPMDFTGRPMRGWLFIEPEGVRTATGLRRWVDRAIAHAESKPPGAARRPSTPRGTAGARSDGADLRRSRSARVATARSSRGRR